MAVYLFQCHEIFGPAVQYGYFTAHLKDLIIYFKPSFNITTTRTSYNGCIFIKSHQTPVNKGFSDSAPYYSAMVSLIFFDTMPLSVLVKGGN